MAELVVYERPLFENSGLYLKINRLLECNSLYLEL